METNIIKHLRSMDIIGELTELDKELESQGYKEWSYSRLCVFVAIQRQKSLKHHDSCEAKIKLEEGVSELIRQASIGIIRTSNETDHTLMDRLKELLAYTTSLEANLTSTHGIDLIATERKKQILKHGRTIVRDVAENEQHQLSLAATLLAAFVPSTERYKRSPCPPNWDVKHWNRMLGMPYKDRLVIAGALIAAEIDRMQYVEQVANDGTAKEFVSSNSAASSNSI